MKNLSLFILTAAVLFPEFCRADSGTGMAGLGTLGVLVLYIFLGIPASIGAFFLWRWSVRLSCRAVTTRDLLYVGFIRFGAWLAFAFFSVFTYLIVGDLGAYSLSSSMGGIIVGAMLLALFAAWSIQTGRLFLHLAPGSAAAKTLGYFHWIIGVVLFLFVAFLVIALFVNPPE